MPVPFRKELIQKYSFIKSQFEYISMEERLALKTALALAAIHHKQIDDLHDLIHQEMPEHIAKKMLETIAKFSLPLQYSYVNPEYDPHIIDFYIQQLIDNMDDRNRVLLQLSRHLLNPEDEPLTIFDTAFLASKYENLSFTFLMQEKDRVNEMAFYCKKAVFQQKHAEIKTFDLSNPLQKFKNLMISLDDISLYSKQKKMLEQSQACQWLYGGELKDKSLARYMWICIAMYLQMLEENGKMAVMIPADFLENELFCKERKFLLFQGCIASIILMPKFSSLKSSKDSYAMMILRPPHTIDSNQRIYFYDACSININFRKLREENPLSDTTVKRIVKAIRSEESAHFIKEIDQNTCILKFVDTSNMRLGDIAKTIKRGAMILTRKLEEEGKISSEETNFLLLRPQDMVDGLIEMQKPVIFLKNMDTMKQYCLSGQETTLLICKNRNRDNSRIKTAIFANSEEFGGKTFLVNSNIYLLKIDEEKANPYYIQAYLESLEGQEKLQEILEGAGIPTLSISNLPEFKIPACDMKTQNRIAETFRKNLKEIRKCKLKLSELLEQNNQLFHSETTTD